MGLQVQIRIAIIIGIILLIASNIVLYRQNITLSKERKQAIAFSLADEKQVQWYKNKANRETMRSEVLELSLKNTKDLINDSQLSFVKQFNGLHKRLNNLEQALEIKVDFENDWKISTRDTTINGVVGKVFTQLDSLTKIVGLTVNDTTKLSIKAYTELQGVISWQRRKLLGLAIGRKEWSFDITSTNPNVHIRDAHLIRISKK